MTTQIKQGSMHHAWQYLRQIEHSLKALAKRRRLDEDSEYFESFQYYMSITWHDPSEFDVLVLKCTKNASKNEFHTIVVSNYWATYMEAIAKIQHLNYRQASEKFLLQICSIRPLLAAEWLKTFHIHFVKVKQLPVNLIGWRELVIADHISDISYIRDYACQLFRLDEPTTDDPDRVGFVPVDLLELWVKYQALSKGRVQ